MEGKRKRGKGYQVIMDKGVEVGAKGYLIVLDDSNVL